MRVCRGVVGVALLASACHHRPPDPVLPAGRVDVALVPGCPVDSDGRVSECIWRRASWAAHLWNEGKVGRFITSGNAVYSPFVEAEALRLSMVRLGVPAHRITTEPHALHTDENVAYALPLLRPGETLGMASSRGHATGMRAFARSWGQPAVTLPMNEHTPPPRPDLRIAETSGWPSLKERERAIRIARGKRFRRPHSVFKYTWMALTGHFVKRSPPTVPDERLILER